MERNVAQLGEDLAAAVCKAKEAEDACQEKEAAAAREAAFQQQADAAAMKKLEQDVAHVRAALVAAARKANQAGSQNNMEKELA